MQLMTFAILLTVTVSTIQAGENSPRQGQLAHWTVIKVKAPRPPQREKNDTQMPPASEEIDRPRSPKAS